jgi:hypothetical protein
VTFDLEILFSRFCSSSLRRWHKRLYLKGILRAFASERGFYKGEDQERRPHNISTGRVTSACCERRPADGSVGQSTEVPSIAFGLAPAGKPAQPLRRHCTARQGAEQTLAAVKWLSRLPGCEDMANGKTVLLCQMQTRVVRDSVPLLKRIRSASLARRKPAS